MTDHMIHPAQILLGLLAMLCFSLGFFRIQFSQGPTVDWTALGLGAVTLMYLLSLVR